MQKSIIAESIAESFTNFQTFIANLFQCYRRTLYMHVYSSTHVRVCGIFRRNVTSASTYKQNHCSEMISSLQRFIDTHYPDSVCGVKIGFVRE